MPSRFFPDANPLRWLAWSAAAVAAVLIAFAHYAALYRVGRFDLVVHAVTAVAFTLLLAAYMRAMLPGVWRPASYVAALVALGVAIGAAWEVRPAAFSSQGLNADFSRASVPLGRGNESALGTYP